MSDDFPNSVDNLCTVSVQLPNKPNPPDHSQVANSGVHRLVQHFFSCGKRDGQSAVPHLNFDVNKLQLTALGKQCAQAYHDGVRLSVRSFPPFTDKLPAVMTLETNQDAS